MIVKERINWLKLLFTFRGSTLTHTWWRVLIVTLHAVAVTTMELRIGWPPWSLTVIPFTLMGLALSIFLGFRNNAAYDRYWEARKLWGSLINTSRNFARQVMTMIDVPTDTAADDATRREIQELRESLIHRTILYVAVLRDHLRRDPLLTDPGDTLTPAELAQIRTWKNVPTGLLNDLGGRLQSAWRAGWIHDYQLPILQERVTELTNIQGGCERIKNTPIPFAYTVYIHRIVAFYCLALPWGITDTVGALTPLVVLMVSQAFLGLDDLGDELEDPFGQDANDLPLSALARTIEIDLLQHLGETDIPEPVKPVRNRLT